MYGKRDAFKFRRDTELLDINVGAFISCVLKGCTSYDMHVMNVSVDENTMRKIGEGSTTAEWSNGRRSVHEMIKRFQQVPDMHNGWPGIRSGSSEPVDLDERTKCTQSQRAHVSQGDAYGARSF